MKVNILGTEYEIRKLTKEEYPKLETMDANGLAELYSKELIIDKEMNPNTGEEYNNFEAYEKRTLRHEIIHAFFFESGMRHYCNDEELVDWLAIQIQKMHKAMEETKCLD